MNLLCRAFRTHWAAIEGKTAVTLDELDRAEMIAEQLITAIGERELTPNAVAAATRTRQRAFTLVVKTYDALRRGITYLRWNERDADTIAPSLYAGRGGSRRREDGVASGSEVPVSEGVKAGSDAGGAGEVVAERAAPVAEEVGSGGV